MESSQRERDTTFELEHLEKRMRQSMDRGVKVASSRDSKETQLQVGGSCHQPYSSGEDKSKRQKVWGRVTQAGVISSGDGSLAISDWYTWDNCKRFVNL